MKKKILYTDFGSRLRKLRGKVTQKEFAEKLGITEQAYQNYEYGKRYPNLIMLFKISALCGLSPSDLIPSKIMEKAVMLPGEGAGELMGWSFELRGLEDDSGQELDLAQELRRLKAEGIQISDRLGSLDDVEQERFHDPRLRILLHKIHFIFEKENETIKKLIIDVVNQATELAVATMIDDVRKDNQVADEQHSIQKTRGNRSKKQIIKD